MNRYEIIRTYKADSSVDSNGKCKNTKRVDERFYDSNDNQLRLIEPKLKLELGAAGSLEFSVPISHKYFDTITPMADEFLVRDTFFNQTIFVGRPTSVTNINFKTIKVYCEGALAYLNDILQRPHEWERTTPAGFFTDVITRYNEIKRRAYGYEFQVINVGTCTIPNREIYRYCNYENTYNLIEKGCIESDGGWLMMSYDIYGNKTLNWYKVPPQPSDIQPLEYKVNLVSYEEEWDCSDACTIPIIFGPNTDEDLPGNQGKRKMTYDAFYQEGNQLRNGYIEKGYEYEEGITTMDQLINAYEYDPIKDFDKPSKKVVISSKVVDRHYIDSNIRKYDIGQKVNLTGILLPYSHGYLDKDETYVTGIDLNLNSAVPDITVGTLPNRLLSDRFRKDDSGTNNANQTDRLDDLERRMNENDGRLSRLESGSSGGSGSAKNGLYVYMGAAVVTPPDEYIENGGINGSELDDTGVDAEHVRKVDGTPSDEAQGNLEYYSYILEQDTNYSYIPIDPSWKFNWPSSTHYYRVGRYDNLTLEDLNILNGYITEKENPEDENSADIVKYNAIRMSRSSYPFRSSGGEIFIMSRKK